MYIFRSSVNSSSFEMSITVAGNFSMDPESSLVSGRDVDGVIDAYVTQAFIDAGFMTLVPQSQTVEFGEHSMKSSYAKIK